MDTVKTKESTKRVYSARAYIFSARPDPTWKLTEEQIERLKDVWDGLDTIDVEETPSVPILGYRGCSMRYADNRKFIAYCGVVLKWSGRRILECRKDDDKLFEKLLLTTAPEDLISEDFLEYL